MYKFELEKGSRKHICPNCSQKRFVRYVKRSNNQYLNSDVGLCDRSTSCGYHYTPKMYFADNQHLTNSNYSHRSKQVITHKKRIQVKSKAQRLDNLIKPMDFIPNDYWLKSIGRYENNGFVQFLLNLFPDCIEEIEAMLKRYFVGTTQNGRTIFWQIDQRHRIRTGKIIAYDQQTGKRIKSINPNWVHARLKKQGIVKQDFNLKQCFFGEHLLKADSRTPICIVEAEKTALIASLCFPQYIWLAIGSKQSLKFEKIKMFGRNRKIILYPDADSYDLWNKEVLKARKHGFDISISNEIQTNAKGQERKDGYDLADYLIDEQIAINEQNIIIDSINNKLEIVKNDSNLFAQFNIILDEQKAILLIDNNCSETKAEQIITNPKNIRQVAMSL